MSASSRTHSIDTRLLRLLKESQDRFLSGEELSRELGITRSAVWKHIEDLRDVGFKIRGLSHEGYQYLSSPDRLFADEIQATLKTDLIGQKILTFKTIDSTNRLAMEMGEKGAREGLVIFSEEQTRGKGRLGRHWASPEGKGLYFSILLRPLMDIGGVHKLTLMAAVSVAEALREKGLTRVGIRWPNDIVVGETKVGGILTEMSAESDRLIFVVSGIGLNVHKAPEGLPPAGISLEEATGKRWDRLSLALEILSSFERNYDLVKKGEDDKLARQWEAFSTVSGKRVRATTLLETISGTALGIDPTGALWIRDDSGIQKRLVSGDITLLR